jgi:hypothetical protein
LEPATRSLLPFAASAAKMEPRDNSQARVCME